MAVHWRPVSSASRSVSPVPKAVRIPPAFEGAGEVVELVESVAVGLLPAEQAAEVGGALHGQAGEAGAARQLALLRQLLGVAVGLGRLGDDPDGHGYSSRWASRRSR